MQFPGIKIELRSSVNYEGNLCRVVFSKPLLFQLPDVGAFESSPNEDPEFQEGPLTAVQVALMSPSKIPTPFGPFKLWLIS